MLNRLCIMGLWLILPIALTVQAWDDEGETDAAGTLAEYFGFEPLEVLHVDRGVGPVAIADLNGNGLNDLIVVNNFRSRIELYYQREDADPRDIEEFVPSRTNELPPHWRYERRLVSITHRISAILAHDFDSDGLIDIIYASANPAEIVFLRQMRKGEFQSAARHPIRGLNTGRHGLAYLPAGKNVIGDTETSNVLMLVAGEIHIRPMISATQLGTSPPGGRLSVGTPISAFHVDDFTGNGLMDIVGIIPEHSAPIRFWLGTEIEQGDPKPQTIRELGPELRFEMPAVRDAKPVRLHGEKAARLGVIERASRRTAFYSLESDDPEQSPGMVSSAPSMRVYSFTDPGNRRRNVSVADATGNGLLDVIATDTQANAIAVFVQQRDNEAGERSAGLRPPVRHPSLNDIDTISIGWIGEESPGMPALFVLSEREGVVGRSMLGPQASIPGGIEFPVPLPLPDGHTPVAMSFVELEEGPRVAVISRENRDYKAVLIDPNGSPQGGHVGRIEQTIDLPSVNRAPDAILALDADQDGRVDLLLLTRDRPMTMLRSTKDGFTVLESRDMGQFGLVQQAGADNTAAFDVDGNGYSELLIADRNYVRAVRYVHESAGQIPQADEAGDDGTSDRNADGRPGGPGGGWQVVTQINDDDTSARLASVAVQENQIIAGDRENNRLVIMRPADDNLPGGPAAGSNRRWQVFDSIAIEEFDFSAIHAGVFTPQPAGSSRIAGSDGRDQGSPNPARFPDIVAIGDNGFAVVSLADRRRVLREFAAWTGDDERKFPYEMIVGDVNGDGMTDVIILDAAEQLCQILTFSEAKRLHYATSFKVFESRLFTGGEAREFEPRYGLIGDVNASGGDDLILVSHDRLLIYPQMVEPGE